MVCLSRASLVALSRLRKATPVPPAVDTVAESTRASVYQRASSAVRLSCGASQCARSSVVNWWRSAFNAHGIFFTLARRPPMLRVGTPGAPVGAGRSAAEPMTWASGYCLRISWILGSEDSRMLNSWSGPLRKSCMASTWIAMVEYSMHMMCL